MAAKKILKYLNSPAGRKLTLNTMCVATISVAGLKYLPNTLFVEKYKEVIQAYRQGDPREVPDFIAKRFENALEICKCSDFERKYLKSFIVYGFDVLQIGTTKSRFSAHVGVPINYFYRTADDIERGEIQIRQKEINWDNSEDGRMLQESLVLTEKEQIFSMARSILQLNTHKLLLTTIYAPFTIMLSYAFGQYVNRSMNLYVRPLGLRIVLYTLVGTFGAGIYAFLTDYTQIYYDTKVDKELSELGPEFIEAGVSFYDKLLKKNIAIRNLIGENMYTAQGNEQHLIRQKSLPLTIRRSYFKIKLDEFTAAKLENKS